VSDQGPDTPGADAAPPRPTRPVKKVAKKRPAGAKAPSGSSGTKARAAKKAPASGGAAPPINETQATTRGVIVIAVTVLIGLLIFWQGFSRDSSEIVATGPTTTAVAGVDRDAAPTTTQPSQGTTLPSTPVTKVPPDEINVIVANSVDPSQTIAGPQAAKLSAAGYPSPVTMDLAPFGVTTSSVYYTGDLESEAQAIAVALGLPDSAVNPIPTPAPTPMNTAQILVIIGQDAA
jgi:hypothetical protein